MADLEIRVVEGAELAERFKAAGGQVRPIIRRQVVAAQFLLERAMKRNIKGSFKQHTGDFVRSISSEAIAEDGDEIYGRTGSNLEYAEIHEEGGEIHAKNVSNLTIPLEAFMTGSGVARGSARDLIANPGEFGYDGTFFSKNVLMGKSGDEVVPLFVLTPSVTLPARPWAKPAADEVQPQFEESMRAALEALI